MHKLFKPWEWWKKMPTLDGRKIKMSAASAQAMDAHHGGIWHMPGYR